MKKASALFTQYNKLVHPQRVEFLLSPGINYYMSARNIRELHAFLIAWTGFSIKMTEKVESWIRRAGEQCESKSFAEVGSRLKYHAAQEADHDLMLVDDLAVLLTKWNNKYNDNLNAEDVFKLSLPKNTEEYVKLHEDAILGAHPYTQVAIEYEIERISVHYGPRMIENILYTLGEDYEDGISFLADHVLLDQGHTKFNMDLMEKCLASNGNVEVLAQTGAKALKIYAGFLNECMQQSHAVAKREQWKPDLMI